MNINLYVEEPRRTDTNVVLEAPSHCLWGERKRIKQKITAEVEGKMHFAFGYFKNQKV